MSEIAYSSDEVRDLKAALGACLDLMESKPIRGDGAGYTINMQLRQRGVSVHFKWTPTLPLLPPASAVAPCSRHFAEIGCNPVLTWQLLNQLEELLTAEDASRAPPESPS